KAHYEGTAKEIIDEVKGKIDIFVAGIGTGGTITGAGKRLKKNYPKIKIIGVLPKPGANIQGLKSIEEGYIPPVLDLNIMDEKFIIEDEDAFLMTKKLAREEGIFVGPSSGAAMYAALKVAEKLKQGNVVVIFPDRGEKYLSMLK
ncbi:pyridoxal-phosphate dependent enzyme, partial [Patescibacteria group bacterium]|nr:pyridoxal-phosphate dependent enzyme [Patescibacteria group bacterium]